jgi:hypothetical protein
MNFKMLSILALLALPAAAQERWQIGLGANFKDSTQFSTAVGTREVATRRKATWAPSLQLAYRAWDFGTHDVSLTGEYQFWTKYKVTTSVPGTGEGSYRMQFFAPGLQWNHHLTQDFHWGLGFQMRFANLRNGAIKANHNRPWADLHAAYTFQTVGPVRPFAGLRLARALANVEPQPTLQTFASSPDEAIRAGMRRLDGIWEMSLQAGVRF